MIFIERGDHSPHRQEPPPDYEYKGKIEVQNFEKEQRSQTYNAGGAPPLVPPSIPVPQQSAGPCPPGWQQMVLTAGGHCGPCPPGGLPYSGQVVGAASAGQIGIGGFGFGGASGLPPNCQVVSEYVVGANSGGSTYTGQ